jgi:hypothetical protein
LSIIKSFYFDNLVLDNSARMHYNSPCQQTKQETETMQLIIKKVRKDGKYPVTYIFAGQPNAFGGLSGGGVFNKILTLDKVKAEIARAKEHNNTVSGIIPT